MARAYRRKRPTRELILQTSMQLFLENGYTATHCAHITANLHISPGNLTFYFPTKEHLLAEMVHDLCAFQWKVMEEATDEGQSSLLAYCMELAAMASLCEHSPVAKDFYVSAYTYPLPLDIIRTNDTVKLQKVFQPFCPDYTPEDFRYMENLVSGIEYGTLVTASNEVLTLDKKIFWALDGIMRLFHVPEELRQVKIEKVLAQNYEQVGSTLLQDFMAYVNNVNEQAVKQAARYTSQSSPQETTQQD